MGIRFFLVFSCFCFLSFSFGEILNIFLTQCHFKKNGQFMPEMCVCPSNFLVKTFWFPLVLFRGTFSTPNIFSPERCEKALTFIHSFLRHPWPMAAMAMAERLLRRHPVAAAAKCLLCDGRRHRCRRPRSLADCAPPFLFSSSASGSGTTP